MTPAERELNRDLISEAIQASTECPLDGVEVIEVFFARVSIDAALLLAREVLRRQAYAEESAERPLTAPAPPPDCSTETLTCASAPGTRSLRCSVKRMNCATAPAWSVAINSALPAHVEATLTEDDAA
jgi:hypothetical protein